MEADPRRLALPTGGATDKISDIDQTGLFCPVDLMRNIVPYTESNALPTIGTRWGMEKLFPQQFPGAIQQFCAVERTTGITGLVPGALSPMVGVSRIATSLRGHCFVIDSVGSMYAAFTDVHVSYPGLASVVGWHPTNRWVCFGEYYVDTGVNKTSFSMVNVDTLASVWGTTLVSVTGNANHVCVTADYVYVSCAESVHVFNVSTGAFIKSYNCDGWSNEVMQCLPTVDGQYVDVLFIGTGKKTGRSLYGGDTMAGDVSFATSGVMRFLVATNSSNPLTRVRFGAGLASTNAYFETDHGYLRFSEVLSRYPRGCWPWSMARGINNELNIGITNQGWGWTASHKPDGATIPYTNVVSFDTDGNLIWEVDSYSRKVNYTSTIGGPYRNDIPQLDPDDDYKHDSTDGTYIGFFSGGGGFTFTPKPSANAVACDSLGNVFVAGQCNENTGKNVYKMVAGSGNIAWTAGIGGIDVGSVVEQHAICIDPTDDNLWVCVMRNNQYHSSVGKSAILMKLSNIDGSLLFSYNLTPSIRIVSNTTAGTTTVTTQTEHGLVTNDLACIGGSTCTAINTKGTDAHLITKVDDFNFTIPVDCSGGGGSGGYVAKTNTYDTGTSVKSVYDGAWGVSVNSRGDIAFVTMYVGASPTTSTGWSKDATSGVFTKAADTTRSAYTSTTKFPSNGVIRLQQTTYANEVRACVFGSWDQRSCFEVGVVGADIMIRKVEFVETVTTLGSGATAAHSLTSGVPFLLEVRVSNRTISAYLNGSTLPAVSYTVPTGDSLENFGAFGFVSSISGAVLLKCEVGELVPSIASRDRGLWFVAGGNLYASFDGSTAGLIRSGVCRESGDVRMFEFKGKLKIVDGGKARDVNPITGGVSEWYASTAGTFPGSLVDGNPVNGVTDCYLGVAHNGRIALVSTADPQNVNMSAIGDSYDWDTGSEAAGRAFSFVDAKAGLSGQVIRGIISANANRLTVGCVSQMWQLMGDPARGQVLFDNRSENIGISGPNSMIRADDDVVLFHGSQGLYKMIGATPPSPISGANLTKYIQFPESDRTLYNVHLARDTSRKGVLICLTKDTGSVHFWYDERIGQMQNGAGGFFPLTFADAMRPTASIYYDGKLVIGCADGYVRFASDSVSSDDGTAIESRFYCERVDAANQRGDSILTWANVILSQASSPTILRVWKGQTPEAVYNTATRVLGYSRTLNFGDGPATFPVRARSVALEIYAAGGRVLIEEVQCRNTTAAITHRTSYPAIATPPQVCQPVGTSSGSGSGSGSGSVGSGPGSGSGSGFGSGSGSGSGSSGATTVKQGSGVVSIPTNPVES